MRRLLIITLCLFGLGLLVWLVRRSHTPAPDTPEAAEPEPEPVGGQPPPPAVQPVDDVVAAAPRAATVASGERLLAELSQLRADVVERVERRPLFVMAEQRGVPYYKLFFMTKPELFEAVLEAEGLPPADVLPSPETVARMRDIAAEAYRRHEEIAAEQAAEVGAG